MCCQAEDYLTALQFLYNGFIRALAAKDLMRCLRLVIVRRIGGSRGGGRGPLAIPYFYPPPPPPMNYYEYVWPIVTGLSNALSPSFMGPRLQALVGFLGRICGYSSLTLRETGTSLRQASSTGVNSALILARSPTACSKGDLNYWSRLVTCDRSTALCVCLCLCRPSFH